MTNWFAFFNEKICEKTKISFLDEKVDSSSIINIVVYWITNWFALFNEKICEKTKILFFDEKIDERTNSFAFFENACWEMNCFAFFDEKTCEKLNSITIFDKNCFFDDMKNFFEIFFFEIVKNIINLKSIRFIIKKHIKNLFKYFEFSFFVIFYIFK